MTNAAMAVSPVTDATSQPPAALPRTANGLVRARGWVVRGAWAILDQGLFALSNFAINIVLARWLTYEDYGVFTIVYAIFLLIGTVHTGLLAEPMTVFGAGRHRKRLSQYLRVLLRGHWLMTTGIGLVVLVPAVSLNAAGYAALGRTLIAMSLALPWMLQLWLMRRACYISVGPHLAASGGLLYMGVLAAGAYSLFAAGRLSPQSALLVMGLGSVLSGFWIRSRLRLETRRSTSAFRRGVLGRHWEYGRWAVGTGVLGAVMLNVYYFLLPARHGFESVGAFKAMMNLAMPALQSFVALSLILLPRLVILRDGPAFGRHIRYWLVLLSSVAVASWLTLGMLRTWIVNILYGGQYADASGLLWIVGLVPVCFAVGTVLESSLRSLERSDEVFRASILSVFVTVVVGGPLTWFWGPTGASIGLVAALVASLSSMAASLRRCLTDRHCVVTLERRHEVV